MNVPATTRTTKTVMTRATHHGIPGQNTAPHPRAMIRAPAMISQIIALAGLRGRREGGARGGRGNELHCFVHAAGDVPLQAAPHAEGQGRTTTDPQHERPVPLLLCPRSVEGPRVGAYLLARLDAPGQALPRGLHELLRRHGLPAGAGCAAKAHREAEIIRLERVEPVA